jgi:hypothetical protein
MECCIDSGHELDAALGAGRARTQVGRVAAEGAAVGGGELAALVALQEFLQLAQGPGGGTALGRGRPGEEAGEVEEEGEEKAQPRTHLRRAMARGGMALPLGGRLGCCGSVHDLFLARREAGGKEKRGGVEDFSVAAGRGRAARQRGDDSPRRHRGQEKRGKGKKEGRVGRMDRG